MLLPTASSKTGKALCVQRNLMGRGENQSNRARKSCWKSSIYGEKIWLRFFVLPLFISVIKLVRSLFLSVLLLCLKLALSFVPALVLLFLFFLYFFACVLSLALSFSELLSLCLSSLRSLFRDVFIGSFVAAFVVVFRPFLLFSCCLRYFFRCCFLLSVLLLVSLSFLYVELLPFYFCPSFFPLFFVCVILLYMR